jgi:hypothetical protein
MIMNNNEGPSHFDPFEIVSEVVTNSAILLKQSLQLVLSANYSYLSVKSPPPDCWGGWGE